MILAAKCAPKKDLLSQVQRAGLEAVELYLSKDILNEVPRAIDVCKNFPLRYAVHAPNDAFAIDELAELTKGIHAEVVVFHNNYWEDEWASIVQRFKGISARLCIENTFNLHEPQKFVRRYGMGRCLDLEHLQIQCGGVYEEVFVSVMKEANHVHLSGYKYGSELWHTHIFHSEEHGRYMLGLLEQANYSGFVVSEAKVSLQTYEEFKKLNQFYKERKTENRIRVKK